MTRSAISHGHFHRIAPPFRHFLDAERNLLFDGDEGELLTGRPVAGALQRTALRQRRVAARQRRRRGHHQTLPVRTARTSPRQDQIPLQRRPTQNLITFHSNSPKIR